MTLSIGDHLVIKRDGKILDSNDEAYHEFEVEAGIDESGDEVDCVPHNTEGSVCYCPVKLKVVE